MTHWQQVVFAIAAGLVGLVATAFIFVKDPLSKRSRRLQLITIVLVWAFLVGVSVAILTK